MADNFKQVLQDCNAICAELTNLIADENQELQTKRNIKIVEENTKVKRKLTIQLEKLVGVIKNNFETIRVNADLGRDLLTFKKLIEGYKTLVNKNIILLKAAHSATNIILESIHKQTRKPAVKTYNAYGYSQEQTDKGASLINYSV